MSELRQRQTTKPRHEQDAPQPKRQSSDDEDTGISLLDIIRMIAILAIGSVGLSYYMTDFESVLWGYRPWYTRWPVVKQWVQGPVALTPSQLSLYNGTDTTLPLYVVVNGTVFDVSANRMIYGPGGSYNFFAGRDATRAFVTGCFKEDLTADLRGVETMFMPIDDIDESLTPGQKKIRREQELRQAKAKVEGAVKRWVMFFRDHKTYFEAGKVIGEEISGEPWPLCQSAQKQRPKRSSMES